MNISFNIKCKINFSNKSSIFQYKGNKRFINSTVNDLSWIIQQNDKVTLTQTAQQQYAQISNKMQPQASDAISFDSFH